MMVSGKLDSNKNIAIYPYVFKKWGYNGKEYIYPYANLDPRILGTGERFEFAEELSIYDTEFDYDVLNYLKK